MVEVGQIYIDFDVLENGNPTRISLSDASEWLYAQDKPAYLEVILPGSIKINSYTWKKEATNILNSHNLGISCLSGDCKKENYVDLPDGIYTLTVKSGFIGIEKKRYYLKTDRTEIELAKKIVAKGLKYSEDKKAFIDYLDNIKMNLIEAKAQAKLGDFIEAQRYFLDAVKAINKMC